MKINDATNKNSIMAPATSTISSIIFAVIISNYAGSDLPTYLFWIMAVVTCLVLVAIFIFSSNLLGKCYGHIKFEQMQRKGNAICEYTNHLCCGMVTFNTVKDHYMLSPNAKLEDIIEKEYSLYPQSKVLAEEENEFAKNGGKEVWIVSSSLSTEVKDGAVKIVGSNLEDGIIYREFYSKTDSNGKGNISAKKHMNEMKRMYKGNENLDFISYEKPKDGIGGYLFDMFGLVVYIYEDERNAYFSIRSSSENGKPIYFKMPWCMGERYYAILEGIRKK